MTIGDARWLFEWPKVSDWVYVWYSTGTTPYDLNLFSSGGYYIEAVVFTQSK